MVIAKFRGLVLVFLVLAVFSDLIFMLAHLQLGFVENDLKKLAATNSIKRINWEQKHNIISEFDAHYWEVIGDVFFYISKENPEKMKDRALAYKKAINRQPAKVQYWVKLAHAKALDREFDNVFNEAFQKAFKYGGWELFVDQTLGQLGLAYWYSIDKQSRVDLKKIMIRIYSIDPYQALVMARGYGQLTRVCTWVKGIDEINPLCKIELDQKIKE